MAVMAGCQRTGMPAAMLSWSGDGGGVFSPPSTSRLAMGRPPLVNGDKTNNTSAARWPHLAGAIHDGRIYWSYPKGPIAMPQTLDVNAAIRIPLDEFRLHYVRSRGPGGQNVNKVNTKAVLTWGVVQSRHLPADVRARFLATYGRRVSSEGRLVITSQRYRDQARNRTDCLEKLHRMLTAVAMPPRARKPARPSLGAVERRLRAKRERADRKRQRRVRPGPED